MHISWMDVGSKVGQSSILFFLQKEIRRVSFPTDIIFLISVKSKAIVMIFISVPPVIKKYVLHLCSKLVLCAEFHE